MDNANIFEAVFSATTLGIIVVDPSGTVLQANPFVANLFGYTQAEMLSLKVEALLPQSLSIIHRKHRENYLKDPKPRLMGKGRELVGLRKDGFQFPIEISLSHTIVNGQSVVIAFINDVSERLRNIASLQEQRLRLTAIIDTAVDGIITMSQEGIVETINAAGSALFGYQKEEIIGQKINMLMPEPDRIEHDQYLHNYHTTGVKKIIGIGRVVYGKKKDGSVFPLHLSISEVKVRDQIIYTGILHDLTEQKQAEQKLLRYAKALERSNRELQDFAYVSSHDLQEPLRKIRAFGDRLKNRIIAQLEEREADYLNRMLNGAERMQGLINDLLAYSRLNTRGGDFKPVNLNEVIKGVLNDFEIAIKESNAQLHIEELPTIEADQTQMWQLFSNLIGNALKFRKNDQSPEIVISCRQLQEKAKMDNVLYEISVSDNGIGFDEKYLGKVFQVFQRLEGRRYQGSGIGLAICQRIAHRHGGNITAQSHPGKGSTFILTLGKKQVIDELAHF